MPSDLYKNDAIYFLCAKDFMYDGEDYTMGQEFPEEVANNLETLVRARFVIPVVDDKADKPRHWHTTVRTRDEADEYLSRDLIQIEMPDADVPIPTTPEEPSAEVTSVEPEPEPEPEPVVTTTDVEPEPSEPAYDPGEHTVAEVLAYLEAHPELIEQIRELEAAGKNRKGIVEGY